MPEQRAFDAEIAETEIARCDGPYKKPSARAVVVIKSKKTGSTPRFYRPEPSDHRPA